MLLLILSGFVFSESVRTITMFKVVGDLLAMETILRDQVRYIQWRLFSGSTPSSTSFQQDGTGEECDTVL